MGLKIHEVCRLDKGHLRQALEEGNISIKGKGGLVRDVPVREKTLIFKYISSKDNKAHKTLQNYRKTCKVYEKLMLLRKWEEDIKELSIENIKEEEFLVTTTKGNKFRVNLENNMCTCKYFYYNRETCKHIIACKRYK